MGKAVSSMYDITTGQDAVYIVFKSTPGTKAIDGIPQGGQPLIEEKGAILYYSKDK